MSRHDMLPRLHHMLDYAREAADMVEGRTRADLDSDRMLELSLTHLAQNIGESASRIPRDEQARYPEIPWPGIVGLRNRLVHGYDVVDLDVLWQIVTRDLPPLIEALEQAIAREEQERRDC